VEQPFKAYLAMASRNQAASQSKIDLGSNPAGLGEEQKTAASLEDSLVHKRIQLLA
jgi:hypothetical protein